jgi:hypothetical protein
MDNQHTNAIYRYKFEELFLGKLSEFATIHKHDDRIDFKQAWKNWLQCNEESVSIEINRLKQLNYQGDAVDKMFLSVRYYHRKKNNAKKEPKKRDSYVNISKEIILTIDRHVDGRTDKPSDAFKDYCEKYAETLQNEINLLAERGELTTKAIECKLKKTYKNRFFNACNKEKTDIQKSDLAEHDDINLANDGVMQLSLIINEQVEDLEK